MKKAILIVAMGLLLISSNAFAKAKKGDVIYKDKNKIHIVVGGIGPNVYPIARNHCGNDKFIYEIGMGAFTANKLSKIYAKKGRKDVRWRNVYEYYCSAKNYDVNPPGSLFPGKKYYNKWAPIPKVSNTSTSSSTAGLDSYGQTYSSSSSSSSQSSGISFTIKDKKEDCKAMGFKPNTEKFAECVLRLVELDVKRQTEKQSASAKSSGSTQIAEQLEIQNNLRQSEFLMGLSQQLLNPSSPASTMTTCRWAGQFLNCW